MTTPDQDRIDAFVRRADELLREMSKSPAVLHLRLAGTELLRAARCGLDEAIKAVEPPPDLRQE